MTRSKTVIRERIAYWEDVLEKTQAAYLALLEGRVKSYTIDDRSVTRLDLPSLEKAMVIRGGVIQDERIRRFREARNVFCEI